MRLEEFSNIYTKEISYLFVKCNHIDYLSTDVWLRMLRDRWPKGAKNMIVRTRFIVKHISNKKTRTKQKKIRNYTILQYLAKIEEHSDHKYFFRGKISTFMCSKPQVSMQITGQYIINVLLWNELLQFFFICF